MSGALALGLMALAMLAGCARNPEGYGGVATVALLSEPEGLNPLTRTTSAGNVLALLFNGLATFDEQLKPVPDLAEAWTTSADGLVWTIRLRKGVKFHDGVELTAHDVVYTLGRFSDPEVSPELAQFLQAVTSVEEVGDDEVRITLNAPYAGLDYLLTVEILPSHLLEVGKVSMDAFARQPVGTGPFQLKSWTLGKIELTANLAYFEGRPFLDGVIYRTVPDAATGWAELLKGNVDLAPDLSREDYKVIQADPRFPVAKYLDVFYYTVLFNLDDPLVADPRFREAIDLALDRADIITDSLADVAVETTGPFRPGTWPYDTTLRAAVRDPERARQLLGEIGYEDQNADGVLERDGKELELSLIVDEGDELKLKVAQRIKWQLFAYGIKVNVEALTADEMIRERLFPGDFQTSLIQFNAAGDPDVFTSIFWHSSQIGGYNLARYNSPVMDGLIERGRAESDQAKRAEIYHQIHRQMAADRPVLFLFVPQRVVGTSSRLTGLGSAPELLYGTAKDWKIIESPTDRR